MIDLFEKVRQDIPEKYHGVAEKAMEKINKCFVSGFPYTYNWKQVPWFDKIWKDRTESTLHDDDGIALEQKFGNSDDEYYVRTMLDIYLDGSTYLLQRYQEKDVITDTRCINLNTDICDHYINIFLENVCKVFHAGIPDHQFAEGDLVYYWDGYEILRGSVVGPDLQRWYKVDFGERVKFLPSISLIPATEVVK